MVELLQALSRISTNASNVHITWKVLTVFCLAGLAISLVCASNGVDVSAGFMSP